MQLIQPVTMPPITQRDTMITNYLEWQTGELKKKLMIEREYKDKEFVYWMS